MSTGIFGWLSGYQNLQYNIQYNDLLEQAKQEDFFDYQDNDFILFPKIKDKSGNTIVIIIGKLLKIAADFDHHKVLKYLVFKLDQIVQQNYSVLYINTSIEYDTKTAWSQCFEQYKILPEKYVQNLQGFFVLHCDFWLWSAMLYWCPWMQGGFWQKVKYINRVEFLWQHFPKNKLDLPEFVKQHDGELEEQPLMDYGFYKHREMQLPGMDIQEPT